MDTDKQQIADVIHRFVQVAGMFAQIEQLPIPVDDAHEVTTHEAHVIEAIGNSEIMNVTRLSSHFGISRSAASQMVSKLVKRGYVLKEFAPSNAKEYRLSLTDLGRKAYDAHEKFHGEDKHALFEQLEDFSSLQLTSLSSFLGALAKIMNTRLEARK